MKNTKLFIVALVVFFTLFSGTGWAIDNPAVSSPIGPGTVPPTTIRSGLIRSPNPIGTTGNLLITGNVRGGRHFRGVVPYGAPFDFSGRFGSSSLDYFLRDSFGSEDRGNRMRYTGGYKPFYSQTGTVTTMRPGRSGIFQPSTAKIGARATDSDAIRTLLPLQFQRAVVSDLDTAVSYNGFIAPQMQNAAFGSPRPMSMSPQELEKVLSSEVEKYQQSTGLIPIDEIKKYPRGGELTSEQRQARMEQFRRDLKQVNDRADELKRSLALKYDSLPISTTKKPGVDVQKLFETQTTKEKTSEDEPSEPESEDARLVRTEKWGLNKGSLWTQMDIYEQMKWQIDDLRQNPEQLAAVKQAEEVDEGDEEPGKKDSEQKTSLLGELSEVQLSARANAILGEHKTFASFSKDKFNQHLRAAEDYLKHGKYYRAADAYTLASIYKPRDPLAYAGKSHALFAAGEYMSSALYLSRALEIFPEYVRFKIDIETMVGDRDKLETRIADVEQWLKISNAPELQFLLGYVYYQMGRLDRAKEAIDATYEKMSDSPAVITLKKAVGERINSR